MMLNYITFPGLKVKPPIYQYGLSEAFADVVRACTKVTGVSENAIRGKGRRSIVVDARCACICIIKSMTGATQVAIGSIFNKDHTTIIFNLKRFRNLTETDEQFVRMVDAIKSNVDHSERIGSYRVV